MANCITCIRIISSAAILLCPVFSPAFYCLYIVSGLTDMIDGPVARKTGTAGEFGAKLDAIADFAFVAASLAKLVPALGLPVQICVWSIIIALIKLINVVSGYVMNKKLMILHTPMNKAAGVLLFVLPLTLPFIDLKYSAAIACAVATFAAIQEGHLIRTAGRQ